MNKHQGTFEFCCGWDAGVESQNKKIQEIIDYIEKKYDDSRRTPDYYEGLVFCLEELKELLKGDSDE